MTSRYTDTQLLLCVYVHLWVCVWVYKEQWDHRKQNFPSEGPLGGLTRQRLASERALGDSVGRHTHTNLIKVSRLFSSGAGWVPMLSAAWGSLRSCECLLESKFVKSWCLNGHSGWEASPPSSPLVIRAETNDSLVTHTHTVYTHIHIHSPAEPRVIRLRELLDFHLLDRFLSFMFIFLFHPSTQWPRHWRQEQNKTKA